MWHSVFDFCHCVLFYVLLPAQMFCSRCTQLVSVDQTSTTGNTAELGTLWSLNRWCWATRQQGVWWRWAQQSGISKWVSGTCCLLQRNLPFCARWHIWSGLDLNLVSFSRCWLVGAKLCKYFQCNIQICIFRWQGSHWAGRAQRDGRVLQKRSLQFVSHHLLLRHAPRRWKPVQILQAQCKLLLQVRFLPWQLRLQNNCLQNTLHNCCIMIAARLHSFSFLA